AGYDAPRLGFLLGDLPVQVLARMRSDRVLRRAAPPRLPHTQGRPPRPVRRRARASGMLALHPSHRRATRRDTRPVSQPRHLHDPRQRDRRARRLREPHGAAPAPPGSAEPSRSRRRRDDPPEQADRLARAARLPASALGGRPPAAVRAGRESAPRPTALGD
ncbi:transposase, partial [Streptomyces sp. NPDC055400]